MFDSTMGKVGLGVGCAAVGAVVGYSVKSYLDSDAIEKANAKAAAIATEAVAATRNQQQNSFNQLTNG